ncbi:MAG: hypothetical protein QNL91_01260 [Candidatus Krumholzibacteria bacterium]|nr:hypothetical protein [Candidatus Krumholzibacteria bacterium]
MNRQLTGGCALCLALALVLCVAGCSKQKPALQSDGPAGAYALVSVNGNQVPTEVDHDGVILKVLSGRFTINDDGTCRSKTVFVVPSGTEAEREVSATYTKDGATLTMRWEGAGTTVGTVAGKTFTMDNEGIVYVYRK